VKRKKPNPDTKWKWFVAVVTALWLVAMIGASVYTFEYKTPTRIKNWQPEP
jgi:hypothetical protein